MWRPLALSAEKFFTALCFTINFFNASFNSANFVQMVGCKFANEREYQ